MINPTLHNFRPDPFYPDFWVSSLGNVCTRQEAERIIELERISQEVRDARNEPLVTREQAKEMTKRRFEDVRRAA